MYNIFNLQKQHYEWSVHNFIFQQLPALSKHLLSLGTSFCILRVIEVCRLPFEPRHDFFLHLSSSKYFPARRFFRWRNKWKSLCYHKQQQFVCKFPLDVHLLRWKIIWWKAPRTWQDFRSVLPFQTRLTQTKLVLPLSNVHGSQLKDQGQWQCCHNKHKKFPYRPTHDVSLLSGHTSYSTQLYIYRSVRPLMV